MPHHHYKDEVAMLKLSRGKPATTKVPLGGGAFLRVRSATSFEVERAAASTAILLAGLKESQQAAQAAAAALGEEFEQADFTQEDWMRAAAEQLSLLELLVLCQEGGEGEPILDDQDNPVPEP